MEKDLTYYQGLPYQYLVSEESNPEGTYWAARVLEIGGISGSGDSPAAAIDSVKTSLAIWLEDALADGLPIPEPSPSEGFSGQFRLRVSKVVHRHLAVRAEHEGVSLNTWCLSVLTQHGT